MTALPAFSLQNPPWQLGIPLHKSPSSTQSPSVPQMLQVFNPPTQVPPLHASPLVQSLPSSQPLELLVKVQPLSPLQPSVVQALPSLQLTAWPPQTPAVQWSWLVQTLPSSQAVASGTGVALQIPLAESQLWTVHAVLRLGSQVTTELGKIVHFPLAQVGLPLHKLPSSTQSLSSLQSQVPLPGTQTPVLHKSPLLHGFPSSHGLVLLR